MITTYNFSIEDIYEAYYECRKGKRNKPDCIEFEMNIIENLYSLYQELLNETWEPSPAIVFAVSHPRPREIWAANFRDRIVHHLIYKAIAPTFESHFIPNTFACIKNRGTQKAIQKAQEYMNCNHGYILKCDVQSFFNSIDKNILFDKIKEQVLDEFLLNIIKKIIFQDITKHCQIKNDI